MSNVGFRLFFFIKERKGLRQPTGIQLVFGRSIDAIHGEARLSGQEEVIQAVGQELFAGFVLVVLVWLELADAVETVGDEEDEVDQDPVREPFDFKVPEQTVRFEQV
jgi:hypothetical protein